MTLTKLKTNYSMCLLLLSLAAVSCKPTEKSEAQDATSLSYGCYSGSGSISQGVNVDVSANEFTVKFQLTGVGFSHFPKQLKVENTNDITAIEVKSSGSIRCANINGFSFQCEADSNSDARAIVHHANVPSAEEIKLTRLEIFAIPYKSLDNTNNIRYIVIAENSEKDLVASWTGKYYSLDKCFAR